MLVAEILQTVLREAPTVPVRNFLWWVEGCRQELYDEGPFDAFLVRKTVVPVQAYAGGIVVNNSTGLSATDGAFEAGMLGAAVVVTDTDNDRSLSSTVASVVSATQVVLSDPWPYAGHTGCTVTVTQDAWLLPGPAEAAPMERFLRVEEVVSGQQDRLLESPCHYTLEQRDTGGAYRLVWRGGAQTGKRYTVTYYGALGRVTKLSDTVGGDTAFGRLVTSLVLQRAYTEDFKQFEVRLAQEKASYTRRLEDLKTRQTMAAGFSHGTWRKLF